MVRQRVDVVVAGAGSSGATVAARLSEDADRSVLLLEAGPDFPDEAVSPPAFVVGGNMIGGGFAGVGAPIPELDWQYLSEPLANGRRVHVRRGKLVGGSSMINGCVAVRGRPADFERWVELGAHGWGWEDVRPYYEAVERELPIKRYPPESWQPFGHAFVEAYEELGFRRVEDVNEPDAWDGVVGPWPQNRRNEVRQGALVTYLRRARGRANLEIRGGALVDRVLLRGGRATGLRYLDASGRPVEVEAGLVVLAGGAYGSAPILLRSGIGPADELRRLGIEPAVDLPVGRGLMDHPQSLFNVATPPGLASMAGPGFAQVARGEGFFSFPLALDEDEGLCAVSLALATADDAGSIRLASADPAVPPLIDHRYQDAIDRGDFATPYETFRALVETEAFRRRGARDADAGRPLRELLLERMATAQHPAGGCAIGQVVGPDLGVYGVEGLRVADASVFPVNISNNLNLTCFMVGERAAAKIAGREAVPPKEVRT